MKTPLPIALKTQTASSRESLLENYNYIFNLFITVFFLSDRKWKFALILYDKFLDCFHTGIMQRILCRDQSSPNSSSYSYNSFLYTELQNAVYLAFFLSLI